MLKSVLYRDPITAWLLHALLARYPVFMYLSTCRKDFRHVSVAPQFSSSVYYPSNPHAFKPLLHFQFATFSHSIILYSELWCLQKVLATFLSSLRSPCFEFSQCLWAFQFLPCFLLVPLQIKPWASRALVGLMDSFLFFNLEKMGNFVTL